MQINIQKLAAAIECAAVKDVRYYLQGVALFPTGHMVATDGHCLLLAAKAVELGEGETLPDAGVIVPLDVAKEIVKAAGKRERVDLAKRADTPTEWLITSEGMRVAPFRMVDGVFPDWRRVYPTKLSGEPTILDQEFMLRAVKARKALGYRKTPGYFRVIGDGANRIAVAVLDHEAHMAIMGLRADLPTFSPLV